MELKCKVCDELFNTTQAKAVRGNVTCSRKCSYIWRGWQKTSDLRGRTFGKLRTLERLPSKSGKVVWLCSCECGNTTNVNAGDLVRKDGKGVRSCGCSLFRAGASSPLWKGLTLSGSYYSSLRRGAEARGLSFSVSLEDICRVYELQEATCALSGREIELDSTASLDRIDSSRGYDLDNIQWIHKDLNRLKSNWPQEQFIQMCREVVQYNGKT